MATQASELVQEIHIAATPADVFAYFTDPDKIVVWQASSAELDARPGGRFSMDVTGRGDIARGQYLDIDPPHRISFSWVWDSQPRDTQADSVVEVTLIPDGDGTFLRLVHRGIPEANQQASSGGWAHHLDRLALAAAQTSPHGTRHQ